MFLNKVSFEQERVSAGKVFFAYFLVHKKVSGGLERTRTSDLTLIRRAL